MFKENDKSFKLLKKIMQVVYVIETLACIIIGIVILQNSSKSAIKEVMNTVGVCITFLGPLVVRFFWLINDVFLNLILDIKLIRNAVYENEEESLESFED